MHTPRDRGVCYSRGGHFDGHRQKIQVSQFVYKRFGGGEGWVKLWIKAAARELAKTIPLHVDFYRIYHTVVRSQNVMKRRFQNYKITQSR